MNQKLSAQVIEIAGDDNRMRHVLFAYLGLRFDLLTCIHVREEFGHVPLTAEVMDRMLEADRVR